MAVSQSKLERMQIVEWDAFDKKPDTFSQIPLLERLIQCQIRLEGPPPSGSPAFRPYRV